LGRPSPPQKQRRDMKKNHSQIIYTVKVVIITIFTLAFTAQLYLHYLLINKHQETQEWVKSGQFWQMDESCAEQLRNAEMVQLKIIRGER